MTDLGVGALVRTYRRLHEQDALADDMVATFVGSRKANRRRRALRGASHLGAQRPGPWAASDDDGRAALLRAVDRLALLMALRVALPHDLRDKVWMMLHMDTEAAA